MPRIDKKKKKCHPKFLTNCLMDQLLCCHSIFFPPFLRVCLESETEIVSMHMCVCLRMHVHICGAIVWRRYFGHMVGVYDSFTGNGGERGRESDRD